MEDQNNRKNKILSDLEKKVSSIETSRNFEQKAVAGRVNPTPQFLLNPKVIVKPQKDEEKESE